ncbi:MAG: hypothetical protein AAB759_00400 [Patescibacteria group bacterium]
MTFGAYQQYVYSSCPVRGKKGGVSVSEAMGFLADHGLWVAIGVAVLGGVGWIFHRSRKGPKMVAIGKIL